MRVRTFVVTAAAVALLAVSVMGSVSAAGNPMKLVGALNPWKDGQFSNVAASDSRGVAFLGSFDDQGVAVIDTTTPAHPVLADRLSTHITSETLTSDSADLDLVGRYLAVSHQPWSDGSAFSGISIYDIAPDPLHPTLVGHWALPGGIHTVQLDPDVESGRPYAYANAFEFGVEEVFVVDILTGAVVGTYQSPEPQGCIPSDDDCQVFNSPHDATLQRDPVSHRMLDYVAYWDSGLRIVDVENPAVPTEVGAFDYPGSPGGGLCCGHSASPTPSGDWVYLEDEIGVGGTGGVHVLDTHTCHGQPGVACHPVEVGFWHINGHPVQAAADNGKGSGAYHGVIQRYFSWDAHNLDVKGEDTLLVANYTMGIRLVDTSDKAKPVQSSFYLPNANKNLACNQACFFQGRETWGAYFYNHSDPTRNTIYASDFWLGFFIVQPG
jgi:hypothetical protein